MQILLLTLGLPLLCVASKVPPSARECALLDRLQVLALAHSQSSDIALDLLERDAERAERVARWRKAVKLVEPESRRVLREFQRHSRLRRLD